MSLEWWQLLLGALGTVTAGVFGGGVVISKMLDRPVIKAQARASEVDTLLRVVDEVRQAEAAKTERIAALEQRMDEQRETFEQRISLLEERERHALTRAAVHEAWDQMAFAALLAQNPAHPPPPPLRGQLGRGPETD